MRLAEIRQARGLSQDNLADMIGMNKSSVSRAESMDETAKLATYQKCAEALGVTLGDLFAEALTPDEAALIEKFRALPAEKRDQLRKFLDLATAMQRPEKP